MRLRALSRMTRMSDIDTDNGANEDDFFALVSGPVPSPFAAEDADSFPRTRWA